MIFSKVHPRIGPENNLHALFKASLVLPFVRVLCNSSHWIDSSSSTWEETFLIDQLQIPQSVNNYVGAIIRFPV